MAKTKTTPVATATTVVGNTATELQLAGLAVTDIVTESKNLVSADIATESAPAEVVLSTSTDTASEEGANANDATESPVTEQHPTNNSTVDSEKVPHPADNMEVADIATESQHSAFTPKEQEELDNIAEKIKKYAIREGEDSIRIGKSLNKAKTILGNHGKWEQLLEDWLAENCDFSMRTARRFMQIAKVVEKKPELKGYPITKIEVLNRLKGGKKKREEFLDEHDVANINTRKLEQLVRDFNNDGNPVIAKPKLTKRAKSPVESLETAIGKLFERLNTVQDDSEKSDTYNKLRLLCEQTLKNIPTTGSASVAQKEGLS